MLWCIAICTDSPCEPSSRSPGPGSASFVWAGLACSIPLPIYRTRGVTCMPRPGITICRVLYFIVKCVCYSKKRYFWVKYENRQPCAGRHTPGLFRAKTESQINNNPTLKNILASLGRVSNSIISSLSSRSSQGGLGVIITLLQASASRAFESNAAVLVLVRPRASARPWVFFFRNCRIRIVLERLIRKP
jgi:hypothetical protein